MAVHNSLLERLSGKFRHCRKTIPGFSAILAKVWALPARKVVARALSGLPNANAKSQRFSYAISQIATLPPMVALNRSFKSQIAARYAAFWHADSQIALASFLWCP